MTAARHRLRRPLELTAVLVGRDLHVSYGSTAFGLLWAPSLVILQTAVLSFVFVRVVPLEIDDYPVFIFSGILAWHLVSNIIGTSGDAFTSNRDLVRRPGFPVLVLPVVSALRSATGYLVAMPVLLVAVLASGRLAPAAVTLPAVVGATLLLVIGPAVLVATLNVRYRDVRHLVQVGLGVLFYATPVFYAEDLLPGRHQWIADVNPLGWVVTLHRQVLYDGDWPDPARFGATLLVGAATLLVAVTAFRRAEAHLGDDL